MISEPPDSLKKTAYLSLAIFAWNEEEVIGATLNSLFEQTIFAELRRRGLRCEIVCVVNGCQDRTPEVARELFRRQSESHADRETFNCRVVKLVERGKLNAWNQFVHAISDREARFLSMMDADILFQQRQTIWNMLAMLENDPEAKISVDRPIKEFVAGERGSWRQNLSLGASQMTQSAPAQLCAQLYCIRAEVARNIYLPKDLAACEDGFIKALVCTDFLTHAVKPERIRLAQDAAHSFEAYTSPGAVLKNQKRQIIGQTIVHVLVDQYLVTLPIKRRLRLAETLQRKESADPAWLKRLIDGHLRQVKFFWQLYPGLLTSRFRRLASLRPATRLACLPAVTVSFLVSLISSFMAYRFLKTGGTDYWPRPEREGLKPHQDFPPRALAFKTSGRNHE
jgi:hypothetical protein